MEEYKNTIANVLIDITFLQGQERLDSLVKVKDSLTNLTDKQIDNRILVIDIIDGLIESAKKDVTNVKKMSMEDIEQEEADAEFETLNSSIDNIDIDDIDLGSLIDDLEEDLDEIDLDEIDLNEI